MAIRLHVDRTLGAGDTFTLPDSAARHAQVRRVQPGDTVHLFDGRGAEHTAWIQSMGRREVTVQVGPRRPSLPEGPLAVTLALGVPANERMDTLVEKATELGAAAIQPLWAERGVLRLSGDRAERRQAHWQAVAIAACEQCGRSVVPTVAAPVELLQWLESLASAPATARWLLDFTDDAAVPPARAGLADDACGPLLSLSGPEGGLSAVEISAALRAGFQPVTLGPRVLRADTAPLALLAWLSLRR